MLHTVAVNVFVDMARTKKSVTRKKSDFSRARHSAHARAKNRVVAVHSFSRHTSRKSHKGERINLWNEEAMKNAMEEYEQQKSDTSTGAHKMTLRALARAYGVPFETLRRRIKGSITKAHQHQLGKKTVLPLTSEKELVEHVKNLASVGFPCTRDDIRTLAYEYAVRVGIKGFSDKKKKAGYYWFQGFLQRFPELGVKSAENLSVPRVMSMNPTQVSQWFTMYEAMLNRLAIRDCPSRIWNFDETGCQNIHVAKQIVGQVGIPTYNITALEKGETSTALIGLNALGMAPPPMIIHRGKNIGKGWSNGAPYGTLVRVSDKGYINKDLFLQFGHSFVSFLQRENLVDGTPHLIVLDSHYSHLYNVEFLELMRKNNIHVFALPSHCSHWLQPLDRGIFRSFKNAWNEEMKAYTRSFAGRKLEKKDFFLVFSPAYKKAMTVANAQGAFRGSGIFPVNAKAIPDHAYEPSTTTERPLQPAVDSPSNSTEPITTISSSAVSDPDGQSATISNELSAVDSSSTSTEKDAVPSTSYESQPAAAGPSAHEANEAAVESTTDATASIPTADQPSPNPATSATIVKVGMISYMQCWA